MNQDQPPVDIMRHRGTNGGAILRMRDGRELMLTEEEWNYLGGWCIALASYRDERAKEWLRSIRAQVAAELTEAIDSVKARFGKP